MFCHYSFFFKHRSRGSPNETRPNFATCFEVTQIWQVRVYPLQPYAGPNQFI